MNVYPPVDFTKWFFLDATTGPLNFTAQLPLILNTFSHVLSLPAATGTADGYLSHLTQSFGGVKTFLSLPECALTPTTGFQLANKAYVDNAIAYGVSWQEPVINFWDFTIPPVGPAIGDRYVASTNGGGTTRNYIYEWNGASWLEYIPRDGWVAFFTDPSLDITYIYNGTNWVYFGMTLLHSSLLGLTTGDDHTQYWTVAGRAGQTLTLRNADGTPKTTSISTAAGSGIMVFDRYDNVGYYFTGSALGGAMTLACTTASTSPTTGALIVGGGIGCADTFCAGGEIRAFDITTPFTAYTRLWHNGTTSYLDCTAAARTLNIGANLNQLTLSSTQDFVNASATASFSSAGGAYFAKRMKVVGAMAIGQADPAADASLIVYLPGSVNQHIRMKNYDASGPRFPTVDLWASGYSAGGLTILAYNGLTNPITIGRAADGNDTTFASTTDATSSTAASVMLVGGLAVAKKAYVGSMTASTTYSNGALVVSGGAGIGDSVNVFSDATMGRTVNAYSGYIGDPGYAQRILFASYQSSMNAESGSPIAATSVGTGAISGSKLTLTNADNSYIYYGSGNATANVMCFVCKYTPNYSGSPASSQVIFSTDGTKSFALVHLAAGTLRFVITDGSSSLFVSWAVAWSPTSGTEYSIELDIDTTGSATSYMFINGVSNGVTAGATFTRGSVSASIYVGTDGTNTAGFTSNFSIRGFFIYSAYQHTTTFSPRPALAIPSATIVDGCSMYGDLSFGSSLANYCNINMSGGNSRGFMYGAFNGLGDGIHLGYNARYVNNVGWTIPNAAGKTTRLTIGYDAFDFYSDTTNTAPTTRVLGVDQTRVLIPQTTASSSTTTGALQIGGGAGVAGRVYATNVTCVTAPVATTDVVRLTDLPGGGLSISTDVAGYWYDLTATGPPYPTPIAVTLHLTKTGNIVTMYSSALSSDIHVSTRVSLTNATPTAIGIPADYRPPVSTFIHIVYYIPHASSPITKASIFIDGDTGYVHIANEDDSSMTPQHIDLYPFSVTWGMTAS